MLFLMHKMLVYICERVCTSPIAYLYNLRRIRTSESEISCTVFQRASYLKTLLRVVCIHGGLIALLHFCAPILYEWVCMCILDSNNPLLSDP